MRSFHPIFGYGCLGVTGGSTRTGAQLMDDYCGHRGSAEGFQLQPTDRAHYRLVPTHTGACASVPGGSPTEWTPVVQLSCRPDDPGQLFLFCSPHPRPPPPSPATDLNMRRRVGFHLCSAPAGSWPAGTGSVDGWAGAASGGASVRLSAAGPAPASVVQAAACPAHVVARLHDLEGR
ncbi:RICIN domain-containing protein [Streptomyces lydicus]|uniref:RICIN domain-containing protein n=1 Tax=Streptomyces lydicus TaxID=47763 RepID=UPI00380E5040